MTTNLHDLWQSDTYHQLLHVEGGLTATEKSVHSGSGVQSALQVSTNAVKIGHIKLEGRDISVETGSLFLTPGPSASVVVNDLVVNTMQVGGGIINNCIANALALNSGTISGTVIRLRMFAASAIANASIQPNVLGSGKAEGVMIWDLTNKKMKIATGSTPTATWVDATGANPVTPA